MTVDSSSKTVNLMLNITGFSFINSELIGKWTSLIKDAAPGLSRATLLYNPKITPFYGDFLREIAAAIEAFLAQPDLRTKFALAATTEAPRPTFEALYENGNGVAAWQTA